jgi:endonuclease I
VALGRKDGVYSQTETELHRLLCRRGESGYYRDETCYVANHMTEEQTICGVVEPFEKSDAWMKVFGKLEHGPSEVQV